MRTRASSITIITPVYNEEQIVVSSILQTFDTVSKMFDDIQYIVVNDGSKDDSLNLIIKHFGALENFIVIDKENGGIGSAFRVGISRATRELILCVPADSPLNDDTLHRFYENREKGDLVVGYREERLGYTKLMLLSSICYTKIISYIFSINLIDYNWIHLYHSSIFEKIKIEYDGVFMLAEVLIKAKKNQFKIYEVPVKQIMREHGEASASKLSTIIRTFFDVIDYYMKSH